MQSGNPLLTSLTEHEFRAGLTLAQQRRDESAQIFDEYRMWLARLEPYFARDPGITVAEALDRYRADRPEHR